MIGKVCNLKFEVFAGQLRYFLAKLTQKKALSVADKGVE